MDAIDILGNAMVPHSGRIVSLSIKTADTSAYYTFLACFESFPALTSFSGLLIGSDSRRLYGGYFALPTLELPEVETIRLNRGFRFPNPEIGRSFPKARDISIAPAVSIAEDVSWALDACLNLASLTLDLNSFEQSAPSEDTAAIQQRASSLRSIEVSGLRLDCEEWVLAALAHPALQTLALDYRAPDDAARGWSIFAPLAGPLTLRVNVKTHWPELDYLTSDSVFCAEVEDAHGRTRRIALHDCAWDDTQAALARIGALPPRAVVTTYQLWPLVRGALGLRALDAAELVVSVHDAVERAGAATEDGVDAYAASHQDLPLRALTLVYDGPRPLALSTARLARLVRRTRARLPLDVLSLDCRIAAPTAVPDGLARTVVVARSAVPDIPMPAPRRQKTQYESDHDSYDSGFESD